MASGKQIDVLDILLNLLIGPLPRSVGRTVIDDEDVDIGLLFEQSSQSYGEGETFIEGGDDDKNLGKHGLHDTR